MVLIPTESPNGQDDMLVRFWGFWGTWVMKNSNMPPQGNAHATRWRTRPHPTLDNPRGPRHQAHSSLTCPEPPTGLQGGITTSLDRLPLIGHANTCPSRPRGERTSLTGTEAVRLVSLPMDRPPAHAQLRGLSPLVPVGSVDRPQPTISSSLPGCRAEAADLENTPAPACVPQVLEWPQDGRVGGSVGTGEH